MTPKQAQSIIMQVARLLGMSPQRASFTHLSPKELSNQEWYSYLNSLGGEIGLHFAKRQIKKTELREMVATSPMPVVVFTQTGPVIFQRTKEGKVTDFLVYDCDENCENLDPKLIDKLLCDGDLFDKSAETNEDEAVMLFPIQVRENDDDDSDLTPFMRFTKLLKGEKKNISQIYIYAVLAGLMSLTLPLGVQSVVSLISGGLFLRPVILLTIFVVVGVLLTGLLQVMQMTIVESVQQRIFSRTALDFAFRIPRIRMEEILKQYAPELVNRFFDILTIQKGLTKLLVEFVTAVLQIIFGLILLSFYHPFFIFFGIILLVVLFILFYFTGRKGLDTSLEESKYKYRIAHWLEELARNMTTFKLAGNSPLPIEKLEKNLSGYLTKRKAHFKVLVSQFRGFVFFKTGIVGSLLVLGSFLVIDREISVGQFVAAELVIVIVIGAVEKLIMHLDNIYDILTATEKLSAVTDLKLERQNAPLQLREHIPTGLNVKLKDLEYTYPDYHKKSIDGISIDLPANESAAIIGGHGSGKSTLMHLVTGVLESYRGQILFDDMSLNDLNKRTLRDHIGDSLSHEHIFEGTLLENLTLNRDNISNENLRKILKITELNDHIAELSDGLDTQMVAGGQGFPSSFTKKIILSRSLLGNPKLVVFDDFFFNLEAEFKRRLLDKLLKDKAVTTTYLISSHDPLVLNMVDHVYVLRNGKVVQDGKFEDIKDTDEVKCLIS